MLRFGICLLPIFIRICLNNLKSFFNVLKWLYGTLGALVFRIETVMQNLINLLSLIQQFDITPAKFWFFIILCVILIVSKIYDNSRFSKYYEDMKNQKDKEIERLADDNRRYRDVYLVNKGLSQKEIDDLSALKIKGDNNA